MTTESGHCIVAIADKHFVLFYVQIADLGQNDSMSPDTLTSLLVFHIGCIPPG